MNSGGFKGFKLFDRKLKKIKTPIIRGRVEEKIQKLKKEVKDLNEKNEKRAKYSHKIRLIENSLKSMHNAPNKKTFMNAYNEAMKNYTKNIVLNLLFMRKYIKLLSIIILLFLILMILI